MQEPIVKAVSVTGGPAPVEQPNAGRTLEERVTALEAEIVRIKAELRTATLAATAYRPDSSVVSSSF